MKLATRPAPKTECHERVPPLVGDTLNAQLCREYDCITTVLKEVSKATVAERVRGPGKGGGFQFERDGLSGLLRSLKRVPAFATPGAAALGYCKIASAGEGRSEGLSPP